MIGIVTIIVAVAVAFIKGCTVRVYSTPFKADDGEHGDERNRRLRHSHSSRVCSAFELGNVYRGSTIREMRSNEVRIGRGGTRNVYILGNGNATVKPSRMRQIVFLTYASQVLVSSMDI